MRRVERIPADVGLQPERTELAWRRTLLALAVASLAAIRVLHPILGAWAFVAGGGGLLFAATVAVASRHRFGRMHAWFSEPHRAPRSDARAARPSGRILLAVTVFISAGAGIALLQLATRS